MRTMTMPGKCTFLVMSLLVVSAGLAENSYSQNEAAGTITGSGEGDRSGIKTETTEVLADTSLYREFVMIGYEMQDREILTGSVAVISGDRIRNMPVSNVSNMLAGHLPGLFSVTGSGEPGADGSILRIRGNHTLGDNSPLVVIDGIPNPPGGLNRLNPADIEFVSVVKDATAAIYGSQAANGIIFVTTRRGRPGPLQLDIRLHQGVNQPTRTPKMADAPTYLQMLNEIEMYRGFAPRFSEQQIQCHAEQADPWLCPNTDWFSEALKPVSFQSKANISVSGGSESVNYYVSLGGLTEDGFYRNSVTRYNQLNYLSNLDIQVAEDVQFEISVSGRFEDRTFPTQSAEQQFRMMMRGRPHVNAVWPNGLPGPDIENGTNPVVSATREAGYDNDKRYYLQSRLRMNIEIPEIEGLLMSGTVGYGRYYRQNTRLQKPWTLYFWDNATYGEDGLPLLTPVQRGYNERQQFRDSDDGTGILLNYGISYHRENDLHSYGFLLGTEYQRSTESYFNTLRRYFPGQNKSRLNYLTRANYSFQRKYLIGFTGRAGRSHIQTGNGDTQLFPAVSIGWRVGREQWFRRLTGFFDDLKLRASWGRTGNDSIESWQLPAPSLTENMDAGWETATQFNIGLESRMMNDRLFFEFDYFRFLRSDILWWRGTGAPQTSGSDLPENFARVISFGGEGSLSYRHRFRNDFLADVAINIGYATNEIRFIDESQNIHTWQQITGAPVGSGLFYNVIGVFRNQDEIDNYPAWPGAQPGDLIFEDVNGDGVIGEDDMIRINKTEFPKWTGGFALNVTYRQIDVSMYLQGAAGAHIYTQTESGTIGNFLQDFAENRWRPENPVADHPRVWNRTEEYWAGRPNAYFLRDTDYIRLKYLEAGYYFPPEITGRMGIKEMRIYINGFNLFTLDRLKILDPEAANGAGQYYPQKRIINAGLSVTF